MHLSGPIVSRSFAASHVDRPRHLSHLAAFQRIPVSFSPSLSICAHILKPTSKVFLFFRTFLSFLRVKSQVCQGQVRKRRSGAM